MLAQVTALRVWLWLQDNDAPSEWWLMRRVQSDGTQKHTLINAPADTRLEMLARWAGAAVFRGAILQEREEPCDVGFCGHATGGAEFDHLRRDDRSHDVRGQGRGKRAGAGNREPGTAGPTLDAAVRRMTAPA